MKPRKTFIYCNTLMTLLKTFANKSFIKLGSRILRMNHWMRTRTLFTVIVSCVLLFWLMSTIKYHWRTQNYYVEEKRKQCGLSVCTPCQVLDPIDDGDIQSSRLNSALMVVQGELLFDPAKFITPNTIDKLEDFPRSGNGKVERIIHQSWRRTKFPKQFSKYVASCILNHASWHYMFWTDPSSRQFVIDLYPEFLYVYDSYTHPLNRPDALRYIVLFHFGGVYIDLDVQCLHPLDPMIKKYTCFLGQEPYAHSIVYNNFIGQASNAFMACRKKHPFMKAVLENLYLFFYFVDILDSTGPRFFTFSFRQYVRIHRNLKSTDADYVYLAPPEYFLPTVDPAIIKRLEYQCQNFSCLSDLRKWQCDKWRREGIKSSPLPFSFTNHVWFHTTEYVNLGQDIDIFEIHSSATIYSTV